MFRKDLEEILKEKFAAQQSDLDHDALWSRVYPEIKKDKKRPFVFWIVGLVVLVLVAGLWMTVGFPSNEMSNNLSAGLDSFNEDKIEDAEFISDSDESIDQTILKQDNAEEEVINDKSYTSENEKKVLEKAGSTKSSKPVIYPDTDLTGRRTYDNHVTHTADNENTVKSTSNGYSVNTVLPVSSESDASTVLENNNTSKNALVNNLKRLPVRPFLLMSDDRDIGLDLFPVSQGQVTVARDFKHWKFMDVLIGYGWVSGDLSTDDLAAESTLALRKTNEKALETFSVDLLWNYSFTEHWGVKSGIDYQMITDRTMHLFERSEIISGDSVLLETKHDVNGTVSNVYGEGDELLITNSVKTRYNYYHSIGLPIAIVFSDGCGRLSYEVGAGLRLSKMFATSGFIQDTENIEYDLSVDAEQQYGRSINTEILLDAGVVYKLSDKLGWRTGLQYRYGLDGINSDLNPITQKYNLIKITTGLRYQF